MLRNQHEVEYLETNVKMHLKYAVLEGGKITLYDDIPQTQSELDDMSNSNSFLATPAGPAKEEYIVMRKECLLDQDPERLQMVIQVQDCANRHRAKTMIVSVPQAVRRHGGASSHWLSPTSNISRADVNK